MNGDSCNPRNRNLFWNISTCDYRINKIVLAFYNTLAMTRGEDERSQQKPYYINFNAYKQSKSNVKY